MKYTIFGENQIKLERYHLGLYYHKDHFPSGASNILLIRLAPCVSPLKVGAQSFSLFLGPILTSVHTQAVLNLCLCILAQCLSH